MCARTSIAVVLCLEHMFGLSQFVAVSFGCVSVGMYWGLPTTCYAGIVLVCYPSQTLPTQVALVPFVWLRGVLE